MWADLARPDAEQSQRFLAEELALLLADLLRSVLSDASPALPADEASVERYRRLADSLADGETRRRTSLGITRAGLAKRCVTWLKLLLTPAPSAQTSAPMREFIDALGLSVNPHARIEIRWATLDQHDQRVRVGRTRTGNEEE